MEIERKFLVKWIPAEGVTDPDIISQNYLSLTPEVRIREIESTHTGNKIYFLTIKGEGALSRVEVEKEIAQNEYESLMTMTLGGNLVKSRSYFRDGDLVYEIDEISDEDEVGYVYNLKLVEVEFPSVASAKNFIPPEWFGKEVTNDPQYKIKNIYKKYVLLEGVN